MTRGLVLFVGIWVLAAVPMFSRTLGAVAVGVLGAMWLFTLVSVRTERRSRQTPKSLSKPSRGVEASG